MHLCIRLTTGGCEPQCMRAMADTALSESSRCARLGVRCPLWLAARAEELPVCMDQAILAVPSQG